MSQWGVPEPGTNPAAASEEQLWREAVRGDRSAAEALAAQTYKPVWAALFKLCRDADLAAELTQETYRKAWASLGRFGGRSKFSTWLYRIAHNTFLNHVRRPRPVDSLEEETERSAEAPNPSPAEEAADLEQAQHLRRAVLALPESLQFTVTARYWAELPVREIAELEGVSEVAVRKRLRKAYALLGDQLKEQERV